MVRRIFALVAAVALIGVFCPSDADAARYRQGAWNVQHRPTAQRQVYPRYHQIDGRSLWDLGKQNGRWPQLQSRRIR